MDIANKSSLAIRAKPTRWTRRQKEAWVGLLFLSPEATKFIGWENYVRFFHDREASANLFGSLRYFLVTVPLEMIVALLLAAIFTSPRLKGKRLLTTLIFMTSIIPGTSVFFIFLG